MASIKRNILKVYKRTKIYNLQIWNETCKQICSTNHSLPREWRTLEVILVPKVRSLEKMFSYDFKTWNDIISRVLWNKKHFFVWQNWNLRKIILLVVFFIIEFLFTITSHWCFKEWLDFHKSWVFFTGKRSSTTLLFPVFKVKFSVVEIVEWIYKKKNFFLDNCLKIFLKKMTEKTLKFIFFLFVKFIHSFFFIQANFIQMLVSEI